MQSTCHLTRGVLRQLPCHLHCFKTNLLVLVLKQQDSCPPRPIVTWETRDIVHTPSLHSTSMCVYTLWSTHWIAAVSTACTSTSGAINGGSGPASSHMTNNRGPTRLSMAAVASLTNPYCSACEWACTNWEYNWKERNILLPKILYCIRVPSVTPKLLHIEELTSTPLITASWQVHTYL